MYREGCVVSCPSGYYENDIECVPCEGMCPKSTVQDFTLNITSPNCCYYSFHILQFKHAKLMLTSHHPTSMT